MVFAIVFAMACRGAPPAAPARPDGTARESTEVQVGYQWQPKLDTPGFECPLDAPKVCDIDNPDSCESALPTLERQCERRLPCACVRLGHTLTHARPKRHLDGIKMLDSACVLGVDDACSSAMRFAAKCTKSASPACDFLSKLGRVPANEPPRPPPQARPPSTEHLGCFRVREDDSRAVSPLSQPTAFCLDGSSVSFRTTEWDTIKVAWDALTGGIAYRAATIDGASILTTDGSTMTFEGRRLQLARVDREDAEQMRDELAALGDPDVVCAHQSSCVRALRADPGPPRGPRSLRECTAREQEAKATFTRHNPRRPLPPECK